MASSLVTAKGLEDIVEGAHPVAWFATSFATSDVVAATMTSIVAITASITEGKVVVADAISFLPLVYVIFPNFGSTRVFSFSG